MITAKYFSIPSILLLIIFASACMQQATTTTTTLLSSTGKEVSFVTEDDIKIFATYWDRGTGKKLILLHMLNGDRNDWNSFAESIPYTAIAIDLRGHGESDGDWRSFSDTDFNNMILDVKAATKFLGEGKIIVIGASIGANVALNYASKNDVAGVILLSSGLDYRGVKTEEAMKKYNGPVLVVASEDDAQSFSASQTLYSLATGKKEIKTYKDAGHGMNMFAKQDLDDVILQFVGNV